MLIHHVFNLFQELLLIMLINPQLSLCTAAEHDCTDAVEGG